MNPLSISYLSGIAPFVGYGFYTARKSLDAGKERPESTDARFERLLEEERQKVLPMSESGKVRDYESEMKKGVKSFVVLKEKFVIKEEGDIVDLYA